VTLPHPHAAPGSPLGGAVPPAAPTLAAPARKAAVPRQHWRRVGHHGTQCRAWVEVGVVGAVLVVAWLGCVFL
jgi:hypothetical protein